MKILILVVVMAISALAQEKSPVAADDKSKTDLEVFTEKHGTVIIQGYSNLPPILGTGGAFGVIVKEFRLPTSTAKTKGLVVEIDTGERYASSARSFIEFGELDSLIKGIAYISKIDKTVTTLEYFEAQYKTKGEFSITVFNSGGGEKLSVAIKVGRIGSKSMFLSVERLPELMTLLETAKAKLDSL